MKKITATILCLLLCACSKNSSVGWVQGSFRNALNLAKEQKKPILVDFYSPT